MRQWAKIMGSLASGAIMLATGCSGLFLSHNDTPPQQSTDGSQFVSLARDSQGNLYGAGQIAGFANVDFGNGVSAAGSHSQTSAVLVKFGTDRKPVWASTQAGTNLSQFNAVTTSGTEVLAAGMADGGAVLVKYDQEGSVLWTRSAVSSSRFRSRFNGVAVDADGNIYAAGSYRSSSPQSEDILDFGGGVSLSTASAAGNVLLVKYGSDGTAIWARTQTSAGDNPNSPFAFESIALDEDSVYVAGSIEATARADFGSGVTVKGTGSFYGNAVLVKYTSEGDTLWARTQTSGSNSGAFTSVAVDGTDIYAGGSVYDAAVGFGQGVTLPATGGENVAVFVLVKYDTTGTALWARHPSSNHGSSSLDAVVVGAEGVYGAGWTGSDTVDLGYGVRLEGLSVPSNPESLLLVRYDTEGTAQEAHSVTGSGPTSFYRGLAQDPAGVFAAGAAFGTKTLIPEGGTLVNQGSGAAKSPILVQY